MAIFTEPTKKPSIYSNILIKSILTVHWIFSQTLQFFHCLYIFSINSLFRLDEYTFFDDWANLPFDAQKYNMELLDNYYIEKMQVFYRNYNNAFIPIPILILIRY